MYDETILVSQINKYSKLAMPSLCTLTNLDNLLMSEDVWERGCVNSAVLVELEKKIWNNRIWWDIEKTNEDGELHIESRESLPVTNF